MEDKKIDIVMWMGVMLVGIAFIFFGIQQTNNLNEKTANYKEVQGEYIGKKLVEKQSSTDDNDTYKLIYSYKVNGKEYQVGTELNTSIIPEKGTLKTIKYNPDNPEEAIVTGFTPNILLLILGTFFIMIPVVPLISTLKSLNVRGLEILEKVNIGILVGMLFIILGAGVFYLVCSTGDEISLLTVAKNNLFATIISLMFIILGIYGLFGSVFIKNEKTIKLQVDLVEHNGLGEKYQILFSVIDSKLPYQYGYETTEDSFKEGEIYMINLYKYGKEFPTIDLYNGERALSLMYFSLEDFVKEVKQDAII